MKRRRAKRGAEGGGQKEGWGRGRVWERPGLLSYPCSHAANDCIDNSPARGCCKLMTDSKLPVDKDSQRAQEGGMKGGGGGLLTAKLVAASSQPLLWPKHSTHSCIDCRQASTITFCRCFLVMPSRAAMVYKLPRK